MRASDRARRLREPRGGQSPGPPFAGDALLGRAGPACARPNATVFSTSTSISRRLGAVIHDGRADGQLSADHGGRGRGHAGFLQLDRDARIHAVRLFRAVAEADDVQLDRRQPAPIRAFARCGSAR